MKRFVVGFAILAMPFLIPLAVNAGAFDSFIATASPGILELLGLVLTGIIGWAAAAARRKWGIEIEARHREAMHSALLTGARLALKHELTGKAAVDLILNYIRSSVPDAIGNLGASHEVLTGLAKAKLEQVAVEKVRGVTDGAMDALTEALRRAGARP